MNTRKDLEALKDWPFTLTDDFIIPPWEQWWHVLWQQQILGHALILEEPNYLFTGSDSISARMVGFLHPGCWEKVKMVHIVMPSEDQTYFSWNFHSVVHYGLHVVCKGIYQCFKGDWSATFCLHCRQVCIPTLLQSLVCWTQGHHSSTFSHCFLIWLDHLCFITWTVIGNQTSFVWLMMKWVRCHLKSLQRDCGRDPNTKISEHKSWTPFLLCMALHGKSMVFIMRVWTLLYLPLGWTRTNIVSS